MSDFKKITATREYSFKFLYHLLAQGPASEGEIFQVDHVQSNLDSLIDNFNNSYIEEDEEHPDNHLDPFIQSSSKKFVINLLGNINSHKEVVQKSLSRGNIRQLDKVDLVLLLMGTYEIQNKGDTPPKVALNEYINLAKKFGTSESPGFINGVLNKVFQEYE